jgi:protein-S-isoprenylcysteine O-methyltransferase Ste14
VAARLVLFERHPQMSAELFIRFFWAAWPAVVLIAAGAALYGACLWVFASVGRGTPGPWDAPRQFVAVGPYRWVRNPIYVAALLVMLGEAWLFLSLPTGPICGPPPVAVRLRRGSVVPLRRRCVLLDRVR